ncbi:transposase family protein [Thermacetogenium phaeum]|nr:transposase family protein [Thermacetogenium phaeum]
MSLMRNPEAINSATLPNRKSPWKTVEEEQEARQSAVEAQLNAWRAILPGLLEKFGRLKDPRRPGSIRHKLTVLMVFGLCLFIFQYNSRREANRELSCPAILDALRSVFPDVDSIPHLDTLARLLERIPAEQIENILGTTVRKLLRNKKLQALLVEKRYVVAIDGTQKFTRTVPFAPEALR